MFKVRVITVAIVHELHKSPPDNVAATTERSLEVHEVLAGGKVCAKEIDILSILNNKNAHKFFESVKFDFIQLGLVEIDLKKGIFVQGVLLQVFMKLIDNWGYTMSQI